jgi:uncharacterized protein YrzB (UPF0473 family)
MDGKSLFITNEQGEEIEFEIILTFESPETKKKYVVYKELGDTEEVMAAEYVEEGNGEGSLADVETEEEFEMIQDVLDAFWDEEESE